MPESWSEIIPKRLPRTALVTGGARRIGRAIALALADAGFAVAIHCHQSLEEAEFVSAVVREHGGRATVLRADLSREEQVSALLPCAQAALGPVGVLVNSASRFEPDEWNTVTRESWDTHFEINLRAPFRLIQLFGKHLPIGAEGVVINIVDQRVWSLTPHFVSYTGAKAGLWALTQSMGGGLG
jgi:NAD(P)-dependent dehydrogenase (short-subunit alcohol dehydrogenase family)